MSLGSQLVQILVPPGGVLLSVVVNAYYDESENDARHGQPPLICVAGYIFTKEAALAFDAEWKPLLDKYGLSHFSMADCNSQWGEFEKYSDAQCTDIQTEFFTVLKKHAKQGFAASFDLAAAHLMPSARAHGIDIVSPYTFCSYWCMYYGRTWAMQSGFPGRFAYFYEQGYLKQPEFARVMGDIFADEYLKKHFSYAAHSFADKRDVRQFQAADILAWQWRNYVAKTMMGGTKMRGDLKSLLEIPTQRIDFNEAKVLDFIRTIQEGKNVRQRVLRKAIRVALGRDDA